MSMTKKTVLQVMNLLGFFSMVSVNFVANALPLNNISTGEVSNLYPNLFTPAGFTFSIWGLIYIMLLAFCVYQARDLFTTRKKDSPFLNKIGFLFFVSSLLNAGWVFAWHYLQVTLSMFIMIALLLVLIRIYLNLDVGRAEGSSVESFLVYLPLSIYLGWINIATIANVSVLLVHLGWNGFGFSEVFWTIVVIVAATLITLAFLKLRQDLAVSLVSIWALVGILVKRLDAEPIAMPVVISAIAAILLIVISAACRIFRPIKAD